MTRMTATRLRSPLALVAPFRIGPPEAPSGWRAAARVYTRLVTHSIARSYSPGTTVLMRCQYAAGSSSRLSARLPAAATGGSEQRRCGVAACRWPRRGGLDWPLFCPIANN